jgi:wyosine [tRNA(Phe)-imidazoG37] synthetase (radical SAM superfamily)
MKHPVGRVYGPVPSRRLGASLGVDVVPMKVCSYDCIYCQLGATRELTRTRREFFPASEVLAEVEERLRRWPPPDVITIAGSGEPTLYAGLGEVIGGIKGMTEIPVALLTNGALFHRPDVRREAARADLVLPSLDAGDEETFRMVNRPAPGLTLEHVVDGLSAFRREYRGKIWLEVMVLAGITDTPASMSAIAKLAGRIAPDRIQLNTPVRPTFNEDAAPVTATRLTELSRMFNPEAEVIAEWSGRRREGATRRAPESDAVLALLQRRPCTVDDIAGGLDLHPNAVLKALGALERDGKVHRVLRDGQVFWHAIQSSPHGPRRSSR